MNQRHFLDLSDFDRQALKAILDGARTIKAARVRQMPPGSLGSERNIKSRDQDWKSAESGVIDPYHRVWGYPTLHVVDGSTITANLGVNPSLTITAQAERAFSMWPKKNEVDQRPDQTQPYRKI